jgi:hypothetical protein
MTWRVLSYIAGRFWQVMADRSRDPVRVDRRRARAEKFFARAGL